MSFTASELTALPHVISAPRFATYLRVRGNDVVAALNLYVWNMQISAAFMVPLQLCEVAIRNGVVEAIEKVHGPNWPLKNGFIRSLPIPKNPNHYNAQSNLRAVALKQPTIGKVVAELNFAFWQRTLTAGQDNRLWVPHLHAAFPGAPSHVAASVIRASMYSDLDEIRRFRNRIAHHEPIFKRKLSGDLHRIRELLSYRNRHAATWLDKHESVSALIAGMP